jgi:hypothetical protein
MATVKQKNGHHQPALTRVVIDGGLFVPSVAASRVKPTERCAFVVFNKDTATYEVRLTTFTNKGANTPVNQSDLFTSSDFTYQIDPGPNMIRLKAKAAGAFGGTFPYTTYEFVMELWDLNGATPVHLADLDPDFDITPI